LRFKQENENITYPIHSTTTLTYNNSEASRTNVTIIITIIIV